MKNIIACLDATSVSTSVCHAAVWCSRQLELPLEFVHVLQKKSATSEQSDLSGNIGIGARSDLLETLSAFDEQRAKVAKEQGRAVLQEARQCARDSGIEEPLMLHRRGSLSETLAHISERTRMVILGRHAEHLSEHMGSRMERVIRSIKQPLLITAGAFTAPERFMIACDGGLGSRQLIDRLIEQEWLKPLPCHLLLVTDKQAEGEKALTKASEKLKQAGFEVHTHLTDGQVEREIASYTAEHKIGMLVMGAYGHSVIRRFFVGSTTTSLIRDATVPVLLIR